MKADASHWRSELEDAPIAQLPTDRARNESREGVKPARARVVHPIEHDASAVELAAALAIVVARMSRLDDVVVAVEGAPGRIWPLRLRISRSTTLAQLFAGAQEAARAGEAHGAPLEAFGSPPPFTVGATSAPLDVNASVHAGELVIDYDATLFDDVSMQRFGGHVISVLRASRTSAAMPAPSVPLVDREAEKELLEIGSGDVNDAPFIPLAELLRRKAAAIPEHPAVEYRGRTVTFRELFEESDRLARWLHAHVRGRNRVIGLLLERSIEFVIAELAVWLAGHAWTPLEPPLTAGRAALVLRETDAALVLCSESTRDAATDLPCDVFVLETIAPELATLPPGPPPADIRGQDLAYVIFTSGSTGTPKGAQLHHAGLSNFVLGALHERPIAADDRIGQLGSFAFDAPISAVWFALAGGATLVFVEPDLLLSPKDFMRWLIDERITRVGIPSSLFEALIDEDWTKTSLRRVGTGLETLHRLGKELPFPIGHGYGPTETTVGASTTDRVTEYPAPLGTPMDNYRIYVMDEELELLPRGALGEGYIAGVGVGRGYLSPTATAAVFLPDPFGPPGSRMYRTGDVLRWRNDGQLEFKGRVDHQLKVRGYRIEPAEIESALKALPEVREAVVVADDPKAPVKRLVAYLVTRTPVGADELETALSGKLPDYMIPAAFIFLDAIPLTPNGKVDRKRLPRVDFSADESAYAAPEGELESKIAQAFARVLKAPRVGRDDDFFALGGDSLLVAKLVSELTRVLDREVPVRHVFAGPTVARLAASISEAGDVQALPPLVRTTAGAGSITSFEEDFVLGWEQNRAPSSTWNHGFGITIRGALDLPRLEEAIRRSLARQEALLHTPRRATPFQGGGVCAVEDVPFERVDVRGWANERVARSLEERVNAPFALAGEPLVRFGVLEHAADEHTLVTSWHEAINDPPVDALLTEEIFEHYAALGEGRPPSVPSLPIRYVDYAVAQREWFASAQGRAEVESVRRRVAGASPLAFCDRPARGPVSPARVGTRIVLDDEQSARFAAVCRAESTTLFAACCAIVGATLRRRSGQDDFVFTALTSLRERRSELRHLAGRLINPVPVRLDAGGDPTWRELFGRSRTATLDAMASPVPLSLVHDTNDPIDHPLTQATINMMGTFRSPTPRPAGGDLTIVERPVATMKGARNALFVGVSTVDARLVIVIGGAADRFEAETIRAFGEDLRRALVELAPDARV